MTRMDSSFCCVCSWVNVPLAPKAEIQRVVVDPPEPIRDLAVSNSDRPGSDADTAINMTHNTTRRVLVLVLVLMRVCLIFLSRTNLVLSTRRLVNSQTRCLGAILGACSANWLIRNDKRQPTVQPRKQAQDDEGRQRVDKEVSDDVNAMGGFDRIRNRSC